MRTARRLQEQPAGSRVFPGQVVNGSLGHSGHVPMARKAVGGGGRLNVGSHQLEVTFGMWPATRWRVVINTNGSRTYGTFFSAARMATLQARNGIGNHSSKLTRGENRGREISTSSQREERHQAMLGGGGNC